jgi:hypothetical protein
VAAEDATAMERAITSGFEVWELLCIVVEALKPSIGTSGRRILPRDLKQ